MDEVYKGQLTVNSGATLSVTGHLFIGETSNGSLNLAPGAGLHAGTASQPVPLYVGLYGGSGTFAPDSSLTPNVSLNLTSFVVGATGGTGTVDLSKFTGPLSIDSALEVGDSI